MIAKQIAEIRHHMTPQTMASFLLHEKNSNNASENMQRRFKGAVKVLYDFLPDDKNVTKERLLEWRKAMESNGYASITILNYVKYINRYLDYVGCSVIRFNKGKAKDIAGMTFGYLTAIEPTGEKHRGDYVWLFECKCGNTVELPATRALLGNTLSCGCLKGEALKASRKYYDGTSIVQSMTEKVESTRSSSGYTGVSPKRDKWQAHITYKGIRYSLGSYFDINDAVKARARAKEIVIADAQGLLDFYAELEKNFPQLPNRRTEPKKKFTSKATEFSKEDFVKQLSNYIRMNGEEVSERSLEDDYTCIINTYVSRMKSNPEKVQPESNIDCPFGELGLIDIANKKDKLYRKATPKKDMIHPLVFKDL